MAKRARCTVCEYHTKGLVPVTLRHPTLAAQAGHRLCSTCIRTLEQTTRYTVERDEVPRG